LKKQKHHNKHLQTSWNKWGENAFLFEVLEVVEGDKLQRTTREKLYLQKYYENWEKCYNFQRNPLSNERSCWSKTPEETKKIRSKRSKEMWSKPNRRKEHSDVMRKIWASPVYKEKLRLRMIGRQCSPIAKEKIAKLNKNKFGKHHPKFGHVQTQKQKLIASETHSKAVIQFSLDGNFIKKYPSAMEASRQTKVNHSAICMSCKRTHQTAGGFVWLYANSEHSIDTIKKITTHNFPKKVQQIKYGKVIQIFATIHDAAANTKIVRENIVACCKGRRKTAGGFQWRYD